MKEILKAFGGFDKIIKFVLYAVAFIVLYYTIKNLWKGYKRKDAGKQVVNGSNLDSNKNYDTFALAVHNAFDNWVNSAEKMNDVAGTLLPLNNDELKEVNNRYLSLYGEGERTLLEAVTDYWICTPCTNLGALQARLKALGIV